MGKIYLRLAWLLKAQLIQPFLELGLNRVQWMEVFFLDAHCATVPAVFVMDQIRSDIYCHVLAIFEVLLISIT